MRYFLAILTLFLLATMATAKTKRQQELGTIRKVVRGFSAIDTNYIEPQHYNFTVMAQATFNYDIYRLKSQSGQMLTFAPDIIMKVGPYLGWRWIFLGYTFDLKHFGFGSNGKKREFDFSIYSSQIGVDLFYRRTGSDYKIRDVYMGDGVDVSKLNGLDFDGISVGITGANLYYIFNHKRFSYPAAFAQSTCQKISCGSWMAGVGYTVNSIELDHDKLEDMVESYSSSQNKIELDSGLMFNSVKYTNINASAGYAYNWVFAKNWLLCASASLAVAYKYSKGDVENDKRHSFNFKNIHLDGIGRFAVVYNNTHWYAGASAIVRSYNYHKSRFEANNIFGNVNFYIGYNFGKKKGYRKK